MAVKTSNKLSISYCYFKYSAHSPLLTYNGVEPKLLLCSLIVTMKRPLYVPYPASACSLITPNLCVWRRDLSTASRTDYQFQQLHTTLIILLFWVWRLTTCSSFLSVVNYSAQKCHGEERVYLALTSRPSSVTTQSRNSIRSLKQKPWGILLVGFWLAYTLTHAQLAFQTAQTLLAEE